MKRLLLFAAFSLSAFGQTLSPDKGGTGTRPGNTLPATCKRGQIFFKLNATAGLNIYGCTSANTWTLESPGSTIDFSGVQPGTNTGALLCGTGCTVGVSGSGTITATTITGSLSLANTPLTTLGDMLLVTSGPVLARLAKGTQYQVLKGGASQPGFGAVELDQATAISGIGPVANGFTGISSGNSGGVLGFTASGVIASSAAQAANLPMIWGGVGALPGAGSRSGNTTAFGTVSGSQTSGKCLEWDASGNIVTAVSNAACGSGGGSAPVAGDGILVTGSGPYTVAVDPSYVPALAASNTYTGALVDASTVTHTIPARVNDTAPATCTIGEVYFDSNATAGSNWFGCTAANTWTVQGSAAVAAITSAFYPFSATSTGTGSPVLSGANVVYVFQFTVVSPGYSLPTGVTSYTYDAGSDAGHWAFAVYDSSKNKVTNSNTATVTGVGTAAARTAAWAGTIALTPGKYWFAWSSDSTSTKFYGTGDSASISGLIGNTGLTGDNLVMASAANVSTGTTTITMPATLGALTALGGFPINPAVVLK